MTAPVDKLRSDSLTTIFVNKSRYKLPTVALNRKSECGVATIARRGAFALTGTRLHPLQIARGRETFAKSTACCMD